MRRSLPPVAPLLALLVVALSVHSVPGARAAAADASCDDPKGDVEAGYGIDITRITSRVVDGAVEVRATFDGDPTVNGPSFSFTVDFEGSEETDLAFRDDGGGIFRGESVYWSGYPMAQGNDIVWTLSGDHVDEDAMVRASKWNVHVGAHLAKGTDFIEDLAVCESGGSMVPGVAPLVLAGVFAGAALALRRS